MEFMKLKDGSLISLVSGAFLDDLTILAENEEEAVSICQKFTSDNISKVEFYHSAEDTEPYKSYEYLAFINPPTRQDTLDSKVIVKVQLRTQSELEIRVSKIEETLKGLGAS